MSTLQRHIVIEVVKVFSVTLVATTAFLLVVGVVRAALEHGLGAELTVPLLPYVLPDALRFAIPGATLLAVCNVYGRMAASNELVAVQASGIHLGTVIWPTLALATVISLVTVFLNDDAVCWGHDGIERQAAANVDSIVYGILRSQRSFSNQQMSISVAAVNERRLIDPVIEIPASGSTPSFRITAAEAEIRVDAESNDVRIICRNGSVTTEGKWTARFPESFEQRFPLEVARQKPRSTAPAWIPLRKINLEIERTERSIARRLDQMAANAGFQMVVGDFDGLLDRQWENEYLHLDEERSYVNRLRAEPPRRWASGFSCLSFALVGLPLAIRLRARDFLTTFFLCFLPILIGYYPLLAYGISAAKSGWVSPEVVWTGNVAASGCGVWFIRRLCR